MREFNRRQIVGRNLSHLKSNFLYFTIPVPFDFVPIVSQEIPTAANKTKLKSFTFNDTYPPTIFPNDKSIQSIDKADEAVQRRLNLTLYTTEEGANMSSTIGKSSFKSYSSSPYFIQPNSVYSTHFKYQLSVRSVGRKY